MGIGSVIGWGFSVVLAVIPLNWVRLWITSSPGYSMTIGSLFIGTIVLWSISAGIAFLLLRHAKNTKTKKAESDQALLTFMSNPLHPITPSQAILKPGENAYYSILGELKEMKTVGYSAGSAGMSVKVAKGVTLRTASARGRAQKGMVTVSNGELVATDQRIIFAGDRKSFSISNDKIINTTTYKDGFGFADGKTTYTIVTGKGEAHLLFAATLQRLLKS